MTHYWILPDTDVDIKQYNVDGVTNYSIYNYRRDQHTHPTYRSVILSSPDNELLSFSPPKSMDPNEFMQTIECRGSTFTETIEGTMINLFFDKRIQRWEIATKKAVGGRYFYYRTDFNPAEKSQYTFREMFIEALGGNESLEDIQSLNSFPINCCYSFVLQHPKNHIVIPITQPKAYLIAVYQIDENVATVQYDYRSWACFDGIYFPKKYEIVDYNEIGEICHIQSDCNFVGITITGFDGERCKIANPVYKEYKKIRGYDPNLQYQYLALRRADKVAEFLMYFPMYQSIFDTFQKQYSDFITNIHKSYLSYYVHKNTVSDKYFHHIYKLHYFVYMPSLARPMHAVGRYTTTRNPTIITQAVVKEYVDNLEPRYILYYLNYDQRQSKISVCL